MPSSTAISGAPFDIPIVGCELASAIVTGDTLQLGFDGPTLTATQLPVVRRNEETLEVGAAGYRDALEQLVGRVVIRADGQAGVRFSLVFENDVRLTIPLGPAGTETLVFQDSDGETGAW